MRSLHKLLWLTALAATWALTGCGDDENPVAPPTITSDGGLDGNVVVPPTDGGGDAMMMTDTGTDSTMPQGCDLALQAIDLIENHTTNMEKPKDLAFFDMCKDNAKQAEFTAFFAK